VSRLLALRALDVKLLRDLWRLRGQVLAIAMVIASGVAVLVMSLGALQALRDTAAAFYERGRFADVFARLERAPERLAARIAELPGVQAVETRISRLAVLDVEGFEEPVIGRLLSIPERGEPLLNRLSLRTGRSVQPGRPDEAVLSEAFAEAHGLRVMARITGYAAAGGAPKELFFAPIKAVEQLMAKTKTKIDSFDLIEANEAFAVQALADGRALGWEWGRVNVNGGAVALGHPIGASGTRILTTLLYALEDRGASTGLATLCLGGGNAVALAVEME